MRLLALSVLLFLLAAPAAARADEEIVASAGNRYAAATYEIDQGERLTFRNSDVTGVNHDVASTANGDVRGFLFASEVIGNGKTSFVEGSQYLTTGSYPFFCTIHPEQMKGTLNVNSAGTPAPRPGSGGGGGGDAPAADDTPPEVSIDYAPLRARTLKKRRKLTLRVGADEAATLTVTVKIGNRRIGTKKVRLSVPSTKKVSFKLGAKVRRALKKGARLRIAVEAVDAAGNPGSATDSPPLR